MPSGMQLTILLACVFAALFALERHLPLRRQTRWLGHRLLVNVAVSSLALGVSSLVVQPLASSVLGIAEGGIGLLALVRWPAPLEAFCGFLLMDVTFYYWHVLNHRVALLWRFHNVHHIDPDLDVSTAFRFHFVEVLLSAGFRVLQILIIGVSPVTYIVYEAAFQANTMFHHSNLRLPIGLERALNRLLVTPRMHGIHHSQIEQETNSNYSVVLPWWDWMHRTLRLNVPQADVVIGVPAYASPDDNRLWNVLVMPFRRQRIYWRQGPAEAASRHGGSEVRRWKLCE
jgi:sterol desaturase/sphingolipid hydroxylase (fatty acid hydroxylase superfamily)